MDNYFYFGLGGVVFKSRKAISQFFDKIYVLLTDAEGWPRNRIHGFGISDLKILSKYPMYSSDSTSWVKTSGLGHILTPKGNVCVTDKELSVKSGMHKLRLENQPKGFQDYCLKYFKSRGFDLETLRTNLTSRRKINVLFFCDWIENFEPRPFVKRKTSLF